MGISEDSLELGICTRSFSGSSRPQCHDVPSEKSIEDSVLAIILSESEDTQCSLADKGCGWYSHWINRRFQNIPEMFHPYLGSLSPIFEEVAHCTRAKQSLGEIAEGLLKRQLISKHESYESKNIAIAVTFALVGWQSMLFDVELDSVLSSKRLTIANTLDDYSSTAFFRLYQDNPDIECSLPSLLLGFGLMLPRATDTCISEEPEDITAFDDIRVVTPSSFNAAALLSLARFQIKWVDTIAPHLEFDKATNTIFLYRWPSFCAANIRAESESVLHSLAAEHDDYSHWASHDEVTQLLKEILSSFRLLFGQDKQSRNLFRSMNNVFETTPPETKDRLLPRLCTKTTMTDDLVRDRDEYRLSRDFPILRERIAVLQHQLIQVKPRGWRDLWQDRRDSAQWYTFWAVMLFGMISVILAATQTVLQAVQTFKGT